MRPKLPPLATCLALLASTLAFGQGSPQERMRACNEQAGTLAGDERKAFMMDCLRKSTPAPTRSPKAQANPGQDPAHRRGICGEIKKLDLLLYDNPRIHGATTTCSYTDDRLLIKPNSALTEERMKRFVFLAFVTVGGLRNDDFMLPDKTYVGFGTDCQVLPTNDAATLQRAAKSRGDLTPAISP